jgi:hypothetical protein
MVPLTIKKIEKCPFLRGSVLLPRPLIFAPFQISNSGFKGFFKPFKMVKGFLKPFKRGKRVFKTV